MARQPLQAEYTAYIKGLITEASPFTYPENASLEEINFILNKDGSRSRRFGIDYELDYALVDTGVDLTNTTTAVSSHTWTAVSNIGNLEFVVIQVGNKLYFFRSNQGPVSATPINGGTPIMITGDANELISGASIYGYFIVVHGTQDVTILEYDNVNDIVTKTTKRLEIRDLFGVDDELATDNRPLSLTPEHKYNLRNQGWLQAMKCSRDDFETSFNADPIEFTKTKIDVYPSNSDIIWACKLASASDIDAIGSYWPDELRKMIFGTTRAPLGKYIIDVFNRGASRFSQSGITLPDLDDISYGGIVSVAAYAGRVFYGVRETGRYRVDKRSPNLGTMIFYSNANNAIESLTRCYAEADPTSEHVFDPIATDGGFVTISEAGEILKLVPMGQSLFVFCSNGVWEIHGGEEQFSALNQNVAKTTDIAVASPRSIVYAEDKIAFWGLSGIYLISRNDLTLRGGNNDLTFATIQTLYDSIDEDAKNNAVGVYDPFVRTFRWLYRDAVLPNSSFFNKELVYDANLTAFYIFNIDTPSYDYPFIAGHSATNSILTTLVDTDVIVGSNPVIVVSDSVIVKDVISSGTHNGAIKYLTVVKIGNTHKITFSHYWNTGFRDWKTYDGEGIDAAAHMLTGYITGGSAVIEKDIEYLHVYLKRTELGLDAEGATIDPSSCTVQVQWEWANSLSVGRWSREFEAYRLPRIYAMQDNNFNIDYGYTTVVTKNKIRGHGKALSILFKTKPDHNCILYGWGIVGTAAKV